jgi:hypothetical protein
MVHKYKAHTTFIFKANSKAPDQKITPVTERLKHPK